MITIRLQTSLLVIIFVFLMPAYAQDGTIPSFPLAENTIELARMAQPFTYFDKVGRRFAVLGRENGSFEAWAYPLKLFRNFEFSFYVKSSTEPIRASDIVRFISVTPEATVLTFTYQSFTIRAIYITPIDEPGALILLDVNSTERLTIVCSFLPVMQPMWPAGLGGQYAWWDNDLKAYLISEPTRKNHGYVGSPAAAGMSYTPAHMLSDVPNQFRIDIDDPIAVAHRFIPIVMAGGKGDRDDVKDTYTRLLATPEEYYRRNIRHYRLLREGTLEVRTPVREINLAFEWAKVAYDNLVVDNPDLGRGMVAGLGISGTSGRPGFGWFFGGDTYINALSLNSYGAYSTVRDAIAFTQKWQREDGKMPHELSQAAAYIDWFEDYPYAYIHGDTSPFYITAMYDYYRQTGDVGFLKESWESLRKAWEWSRSTDENGDGLMDNKKAGLGALEYGPLTNIQSDIYAGAVWVRAAMVMPELARAVGDAPFERRASDVVALALRSFRTKFWDEKNKQYAYAFDASGAHVDIVSPWAAVGLMWGLGEPEKSVLSLQKLNSAELTTDWGVRSISNKSMYFEPLNYNYGAVWPFLTSWVATAQYKHHLSLQGYNSLMASVRHTFDNGLGMVTEVFSGHQNVWPQEAVAHQGFCTAGVVLPLARGMLGLEGDAVEKKVRFAPQVPADWESMSALNYRVGTAVFGFDYRRSSGRIELDIQSLRADDYAIEVELFLPKGTGWLRASLDDRPVKYDMKEYEQAVGFSMTFKGLQSSTLIVEFEPMTEVLPPVIETKTGDQNQGLKIISTAYDGGTLTVTAEGLSGRTYLLPLLNSELVKKVQGAVLTEGGVEIQIPAQDPGKFMQQEVKLTLK